MKPGEELRLEIRITGNSFELTDVYKGQTIMSVRSCGMLPLNVYDNLKGTLERILDHYLVALFTE